MESNGRFKFMAGAAHLCIGVIGVFGPFIIWLIYRKKSKYTSFQSLQALLYQALTSMLLLLFSISLILLSVLVSALAGTKGYSSLIGMGILLLIVAGVFGSIIYGWFGAYKCFKGEDFKYVIIGDWLVKR